MNEKKYKRSYMLLYGCILDAINTLKTQYMPGSGRDRLISDLENALANAAEISEAPTAPKKQ